ncbi:MAG: type II toxin-antitoxin system prevent-host-death family antitoxin [Coriobacteriia bacterium]|nr:type II toxin-antitoxin system prevent-host-death family antitoxin [Coriobacteriia bacterium]MCL2536769.1 type II toxin-antitoxin system prevent-host-death family antitoxin [Coriobacteriia bacterium]
MVFYTVRELRNNTKTVQQAIKGGGEVVITNNGKPWALMLDIAEDDLFEVVHAVKSARMARALEKIREDAIANGTADLSIQEIDAEIASYRNGRHIQAL